MADKKLASKLKSTRPDIASIAGIFVALGAIIGGLIYEGGSVGDLTQISAAVIGTGGHFGSGGC